MCLFARNHKHDLSVFERRLFSYESIQELVQRERTNWRVWKEIGEFCLQDFLSQI